jgi:hypothetical protein
MLPNATTCPYNYEWSTMTGSCQKCQPYQKYNTVTQKCDNFCQLGEVYNSNLGICSGTISNCPVGLVFDVNQMLCYCEQGPNFKYYPELEQCLVFCPTGQLYNYLTQVCVIG